MKIGAPLLSGVFGGDVTKLSVRAVMAPFVAMERERKFDRCISGGLGHRRSDIHDAHGGLGTLIDHMVAAIPQKWIRLSVEVTSLDAAATGWQIRTSTVRDENDSMQFSWQLLHTSPELWSLSMRGQRSLQRWRQAQLWSWASASTMLQKSPFHRALAFWYRQDQRPILL